MVHIKQSQRTTHILMLVLFTSCDYFKGPVVPDPKF